MEQKFGRLPAVIVTVLAALAAYGLRLHQLNTVFDETGKVLARPGISFFSVFCIVLVLLFAAYSFLLRPRKKYGAVSGRTPVALGGTVLAALALVMGSAAMLLSPEQDSDRLVAAGGFVTALCWIAVAFARYRGQKAHAALFLVPALFYMVKLIRDFRFWSRDPVILDYCYDLLALICILCAVLHLGGFCFGQGRRRLTVFFSLCGVFFGAAALAGARPRELAVTGGAMLWLLVNLWLLLRPGKKRPAPEEKPK